jgi:smad nuclear-interacting protein 1
VPDVNWRLYVFKNGEQIGRFRADLPIMLRSIDAHRGAFSSRILDLVHVHKKSAYFFGREKAVVDVLTEHPSCSKQHAVLQFRLVDVKTSADDFGTTHVLAKLVKPYIIDLESTNGTFLNGERIEPARYYELRKTDLLKFASSTREYVLLSSDD